jgi:hypothetical protein
MVLFEKVGGGRWVMSKGNLYLLVEGFSFVIESVVHGERSRGRLMDMLMGGLGVRIKGFLYKSHEKNHVFGCGGV